MEDRIAFLKFAIEALKADILGDTISNVLFETPEDECGVFPIYMVRRDWDMPVPEKREVPFKNNTVFALPYDFDKLVNATYDIARDGFKGGHNIFDGWYFPEIHFVMIQNGRHHASVASLYHIGSANLDVYPLADVFDKLTIDGVEWTWELPNNSNPDGDSKCSEHFDVADSRFALMYALAQEIYQLEKEKA